EEPGRGEPAGRSVAARLGAERQIVHGAARPGDAVVEAAVDVGVEIEVVGVVGADLQGLVREAVEAGRFGVGELDAGFERAAREARQVPEAFGARQRVGRSVGPKDLRAGTRERVAKARPRVVTHRPGPYELPTFGANGRRRVGAARPANRDRDRAAA